MSVAWPFKRVELEMFCELCRLVGEVFVRPESAMEEYERLALSSGLVVDFRALNWEVCLDRLHGACLGIGEI